jgi:hypothetical protein
MVRSNSVAWARRHADQYFELGHHRGKCRAQSRRDPENSQESKVVAWDLPCHGETQDRIGSIFERGHGFSRAV